MDSGFFDQSLDYKLKVPMDSFLSDPVVELVFSNLMDNTLRHGKGATRVTISCKETGVPGEGARFEILVPAGSFKMRGE